MDEAIDLHFNFNNITHYLHPVLLPNLCGWQEINGTFVIKKYHGCKKRNRSSTRKLIDYFRGDKCSKPTFYPYWRKTKDKYTYKGKTCFTRKTVRELRQLKRKVLNFN